ncbi:plasminogen activator inhibitor [Perilla frutescens var. hirtella]|uniref:Plasminogen activator inhibitor n=1 Tax=Perilla frutescens var. hirtella TaxID=608512 RepID=A0AAD4IY16_PERFH|nr:plasminogen activator inhibitor [Perilla frutescens var. hirtella]
MPQSRFVADALGVVTICLVAVLVLLGLFCIIYSFYFRSRIHGQGLVQLSYFSGPWIIRITYIFFAVWWGFGEIIRLNLLRQHGRVLDALTLEWQENVCKCYIISNLGFAEPCLFLTLIFLLRASLQRSGTLSHKWNVKTAGYVLLYCLPMFILQLVVILIGPKYKKEHNPKLPSYFIRAASPNTNHDTAFCTYPLLSTIFLGLFATILTVYLFWLGRRILHLVINKGLQKRVYTLIFSIASFFPLRVLLLGLSVLSEPEKLVFDAIAFLSFLSLLCCAGVGICMLVYLPIADSLSLRSLQIDTEGRGDTISLIPNQSPVEGSLVSSPGRNSSASGKRGSISFRAMEKDEGSGAAFVELSLFNPSQHSSPPGSPRLLGWPMVPPAQG